MAEQRAWSRYVAALDAFHEAPSPANEAAVVSSYAEWARQFAPEHADELITTLCGLLARGELKRAA